MQEQPTKTSEQDQRLAKLQKSKPSSFQRLRGLQHYRQQQEHHRTKAGEWQSSVELPESSSTGLVVEPATGFNSSERAATSPSQTFRQTTDEIQKHNQSTDNSNFPSLGTKTVLDKPRSAKVLTSPEDEEAGLHALDQYFAKELARPSDLSDFGGRISSQENFESLPENSSKKIKASPAVAASVKEQPRNLLERYEAQLPKLHDEEALQSAKVAPALRKQEAVPSSSSPKESQTPFTTPLREPAQPILAAKTTEPKLSPYQRFVAELSYGEMEYLLEESNATVRGLLLKSAPRQERIQILRQMPRKKRAELLRSLAQNNEQIDSDVFLKAFHWLQRKVEQRQRPSLNRNGFAKSNSKEEDRLGEVGNYPEVSGMKVLSQILDGLLPEQEEQILQVVLQDDHELAAWLERDRGSSLQRGILRRLSREIRKQELALLYGIPHYGRLLRHLLDGQEKLEVLNASIDLAQLPKEQRDQLEEQLLGSYPILQECE